MTQLYRFDGEDDGGGDGGDDDDGEDGDGDGAALCVFREASVHPLAYLEMF